MNLIRIVDSAISGLPQACHKSVYCVVGLSSAIFNGYLAMVDLNLARLFTAVMNNIP